MEIGQLQQPGTNAIAPQREVNASQEGAATAHEAQESFKQAFQEALEGVNDSQLHSEDMTKRLAAGDVDNIHDVTIAAQKADITFQTTAEVRNRVIEAYQEVMQMQI
ncbi:flagellar hook-basal body complex protein FliE [Salsuginibacillus kocurii]|uniref:flagellar hook-basal body complex protein FliE n=1 Tax=Salsuginibacillus kocurii TaxID=427078 RepID=UPI00035CD4B3|nr:flagellar hook-basal body complex protein FliE [Salsuginibacillus kocurii]